MFSGSLVSTLAVSTHSRPKAAALFEEIVSFYHTSFNTQPPEGGCMVNYIAFMPAPMFQHTAARRRLHGELYRFYAGTNVSTHSRPKAAAPAKPWDVFGDFSFNTQPPEGGCAILQKRLTSTTLFQHTAARRRLPILCQLF